MCDTLRMQVIKALNDLFKVPSTNWLLDLSVGALLFDILVQTYALNEISYNADLFLSFYKVMHFNYIWMINFL